MLIELGYLDFTIDGDQNIGIGISVELEGLGQVPSFFIWYTQAGEPYDFVRNYQTLDNGSAVQFLEEVRSKYYADEPDMQDQLPMMELAGAIGELSGKILKIKTEKPFVNVMK